MTIQEMLDACGGRWLGERSALSRTPVKIVTDSRQAEPDSLFLALRGERTDGHRYIPDVLSRGALAVLCEEEGPGGRMLVPNVMEAMRQIASANRAACRFPFVGVTGSVGKTTAKEMIAAVLSAHGLTFKTPGSMNGQIGLPAALMGMDRNSSAAVIEMGISQFGEMTRLTHIVRPDIAVFTNIGDAHLEFLGDRTGVLRAKAEILSGMGADGVVLVNGDDDLLRDFDFGRRTIRFGLRPDCDLRAIDVQNADGTELACRIAGEGRDFPIRVPVYGDYMIYAVLAAAAVGIELDLTEEEIASGIKAFQTVGRRSRVVKTPYCTLIDDCYNANPTSNRAAIASMARLPGRKVCVLGDMREMGAASAALHRQIGAFAAEQGIALVITQGEDAVHIAEGAGKKGVHFADRPSLLKALPDLIRPGDTVLVKASHGSCFENVAECVENLR